MGLSQGHDEDFPGGLVSHTGKDLVNKFFPFGLPDQRGFGLKYMVLRWVKRRNFSKSIGPKNSLRGPNTRRTYTVHFLNAGVLNFPLTVQPTLQI